MDTVDAEFKVQVRTGGPAGAAHGAHDLALRDSLALAHVDAAQVGIDCAVAVAMAHDDHIAKAALHTREFDHAIAHGMGRGACGGGV